jgi:hypothetical protein
MSAISAIEAAGLDEDLTAEGGWPPARSDRPRARLQLLPPPTQPLVPRSAPRVREIADDRAAAARPATPGQGPGQADAEAAVVRRAPRPVPESPAPLRLTRRGRIVLGLIAVVLATLALTVVSMSLSDAQAANHGRAGAGYQGMRQVVVEPGETLWSIASQAEPSADPRQVVAEIMTANSLTSSNVQAGQLLWVPR